VSLDGGTVVRPLFFEFPGEFLTYDRNGEEFMWGPAMLVVPVLEPNVSVVRGYLPHSAAAWFSLSEAHQFGARVPSGYVELNAPRNTPLPVFLRGIFEN
jgi:alpha-glucosidase (family GH31 glycosyl hydrolase)